MEISDIYGLKYTVLSCSSRTFSSISELSANLITFPVISIDFGIWILSNSFGLQLDTNTSSSSISRDTLKYFPHVYIYLYIMQNNF